MDPKIPIAMFAYWTTVSIVMGVTPFKVMFRANCQVPLDVIFPGPMPNKEEWRDYPAICSSSCNGSTNL